MKFRVPLSVLGASLDDMADFPYREPGAVKYDGPTLVVRGTKSRYVGDDSIPAIKKFFPNSEIADVEAGHWLISENPEGFRQGRFTQLSFPLGQQLLTCCVFLSGREIPAKCAMSKKGGCLLEENKRLSCNYSSNRFGTVRRKIIYTQNAKGYHVTTAETSRYQVKSLTRS